MFHGNPYPDETKLSFSFNAQVSSVKGWNNLSIEGVDKPEVIPLKGTSISISTSSTTVTGTGTEFTDNDIEVGDYLYYYNPSGVATLIGTISAVASNTSITLSANATATDAALYGAFILTTKTPIIKSTPVINMPYKILCLESSSA